MNDDKLTPQLNQRKPLSKRTRFAVFKRDLFACQYCGATPPAVVLEVDHIEPVAEGGSDDEGNLVTACFDCNRGKAAIPLTVAPEALAVRAARIAEAEEQLAGYRAVIRDQQDRKDADVWDVIEALYGVTETTHERFRSVQRFLDRLPYEEVVEAARITRTNMSRYGVARQFKYFCGVCWNKLGAGDE
jgi:hypothetical protein